MAILSSTILIPASLKAGCLTDCEETNAVSRPANIYYDQLASPYSSNYRDRSHNIGDVKNSVLGDMTINVGHEKVDIRTDSNSNNNVIDTSINSTIILGDMKQ